MGTQRRGDGKKGPAPLTWGGDSRVLGSLGSSEQSTHSGCSGQLCRCPSQGPGTHGGRFIRLPLLLSLNFSDSCQPQLEEKPGGSLHSDLFGCACGIFSFTHPGLTYFHSQGVHYLYAFFFLKRVFHMLFFSIKLQSAFIILVPGFWFCLLGP